jgi:hypothetical protein
MGLDVTGQRPSAIPTCLKSGRRKVVERLTVFRLLSLVGVLALPVFAQGITVAVLDANGVSDASPRRLQRMTEAALRQSSGLAVSEGPAWKKGAPKRCGSADDCARDLAASLGSTAAVLLDLKPGEGKGDRVAVEVQLWVDGERVGSKKGEGTLDGFETAVKPVIEGLLPAWARKGFGALQVELEPGAVLKVDGRLVGAKSGSLVSVVAGTHQVDVVFSGGHALLQRLEVAEGNRVKVEVTSPAQAVNTRRPTGTTVLRGVSYGVFIAGTAAIAGGLVAGALGRGTGRDLSSCMGDNRTCATLDSVLEKQAQAEAYASTGNVLLGIGTGLAITGAGLFVIDVLAN